MTHPETTLNISFSYTFWIRIISCSKYYKHKYKKSEKHNSKYLAIII